MTDSERALASGLVLVLENMRLSVREKFAQLMPSVYHGELATLLQLLYSTDAMS